MVVLIVRVENTEGQNNACPVSEVRNKWKATDPEERQI